MLGSEEAAGGLEFVPGGAVPHASTFGGNALACAAARAVIDGLAQLELDRWCLCKSDTPSGKGELHQPLHNGPCCMCRPDAEALHERARARAPILAGR